MNRKNIYSSSFFLLLGIVICIGAWHLGIGQIKSPRAGFIPFLSGTAISFIALTIFFLTLFEPRQKIKIEARRGNRGNLRKISVTMAVLLFLFVFVEILGFIVTVWISFFLLLKFVEPQEWRSSLLMSVLLSAGFYVVFRILLKVPFPPGIFGH
jgi:hypothetical protein